MTNIASEKYITVRVLVQSHDDVGNLVHRADLEDELVKLLTGAGVEFHLAGVDGTTYTYALSDDVTVVGR